MNASTESEACPRSGKHCAPQSASALDEERQPAAWAFSRNTVRVLTVDEVTELARAEGLGEDADTLLAAVRPGWRLEAAGGQASVVRLGGEPELSRDESWPVNRRGVPMTFLAQIEAGALPAIDPAWADRATVLTSGTMRVFADLLDSPHESGPAVVLFSPTSADLRRTPHPLLTAEAPPWGPWDDLTNDERFWRFDEHQLAAVPFLTAPEYLSGLRENIDDFSERADRYTQFAYRLRIDGAPVGDYTPWGVHHVLGEPSSVGDDTRFTGMGIYGDAEDAAAEGVEHDPSLDDVNAWSVLLALHDDDALGLNIHDAGALHVLMPATDLAAERFHRAVCDVA